MLKNINAKSGAETILYFSHQKSNKSYYHFLQYGDKKNHKIS